MAALGSLTVDAWRGDVQGKQKPVEVVTRAGVSGTGLLVGAATATPFQVDTDYAGTLAEVTTWRNSALGMVGTAVAATDGKGAAWTDVAVLGVEFVIMPGLGLGGTKTHVIRATWRLAAEA
jgi:hypothetical protein